MKPTFTATRSTWLPAGIGVAALVLAGCANVPYIAGVDHVAKDAPEVMTGSNLVRKGKPSAVREMDKDALEASMRSSGAIRDTGK